MIIKSHFKISSNSTYNIVSRHPIKTAVSVFACVVLLGVIFNSLKNTLIGRVKKENPTTLSSVNPINKKKQISPNEPVSSHRSSLNLNEIISSVNPIDKNFTENYTIEEQRSAHEKAKVFLKDNLPGIGSSIDFVSPPEFMNKLPQPNTFNLLYNINHTEGNMFPELKEELRNPDYEHLDSSVFSYQFTEGVQKDILNDSRSDDQNLTIYVAASQFNGAEAVQPVTLKPGTAVENYQNDRTQGPQAQLAFKDEQVEMINIAANLGYNCLVNVLDENTKGQVHHGYLMVSKEEESNVISNLIENGKKLEFPCVSGFPKEGNKQIYMMLMAAPATGYTDEIDNSNQHEIQYLCAWHALRAQFNYSIKLAKETGKKIILKSAAVGLGVFANHPCYVAKAFYSAAKEFTEELKNHDVKVQFQIFRSWNGPDKTANHFAKLLGLEASSIDNTDMTNSVG